MKQKVYFKTFGCRTNLFDTQVMKNNLSHYECVEDEESADIVVVNSCTVTNGADSGVRSYLHKMRQANKRVYFTGCGVGTRGNEVYTKNLAYGIFAHSFKENIDSLLASDKRFFLKECEPEHIDSTIVTHFEGKSRAFIKIQEGCDFACSYCVIPSVRGRARSYGRDQILKQVRILARSGITEVVLTGTNVGSYGKERGESLAHLIYDIYSLGVLKRLRVGSLEPSQIDDNLKAALKLEIMERHLHIALQHTSDRMLQIMNRPNRVKSDLRLFEYFAHEGYCLGSDYILAHPGESEELWREALENFKCFPLTHLHPFIYSKRDGTPSSKMSNDIRGDIAKERLHILKAIVEEKNYTFRSKYRLPLQILCESRQNTLESGFMYSGLDEYFNRMYISSKNPNLEGQWLHIEDYTIQKEGNYAKI